MWAMQASNFHKDERISVLYCSGCQLIADSVKAFKYYLLILYMLSQTLKLDLRSCQLHIGPVRYIRVTVFRILMREMDAKHYKTVSLCLAQDGYFNHFVSMTATCSSPNLYDAYRLSQLKNIHLIIRNPTTLYVKIWF